MGEQRNSLDIEKAQREDQALQELFGSYLSRNMRNLEKRIKELGWPEDSLERMEKAGLIKIILATGPGNTHYQRRSKSERYGSKEVRKKAPGAS